MQTMLATPSAWAASMSAWMASRFRSRPAICNVDSIPRSASRCATATGAIAILDAAESVRLKAVTKSFNASPAAIKSRRSVPLGGLSSAVRVKSLLARESERLLMGDL